MVLPDSHRISRVLRYSGAYSSGSGFRLRGSLPLWPAIQRRSANRSHDFVARPTTPERFPFLVWAVPRSLAATGGITVLFSVPQGTKMVQFPWFALNGYVFTMQFPCGRVIPFGHLRIKAHLAAPRSFSQPVTSFIAVRCLGIHRALLSRLRLISLKLCRYFVFKEQSKSDKQSAG